MGRRIHPDWPELPEEELPATYELDGPLYDLAAAFEAASYNTPTPVGIADVATIELYHVSYHGGPAWTPENGESGSELDMQVLGTLRDGRWFALEAWNDYTGWGCQDGADLYVAETRERVIANGLTESGRLALGLPTVMEKKRTIEQKDA